MFEFRLQIYRDMSIPTPTPILIPVVVTTLTARLILRLFSGQFTSSVLFLWDRGLVQLRIASE